MVLQIPHNASAKSCCHLSCKLMKSHVVDMSSCDVSPQAADQEGLTFTDYKPAKLSYGKQHPDAVVETASLAAVEPPDVTYELHLDEQIENGTLSGLQLESIVYACQRHEHCLPDGSRAGFFIGDGEF